MHHDVHIDAVRERLFHQSAVGLCRVLQSIREMGSQKDGNVDGAILRSPGGISVDRASSRTTDEGCRQHFSIAADDSNQM
jgi:hypothetical protein